MPRLAKREGHYALMVDGKPYLVLGGQVNNSSAWPAIMPKVWPLVEAMHLNTVEVPVYWEQLEPAPGAFDYSIVDLLVKQAREHKVHLVILWFATWKNGRMHYVPEWIKTDPVRYPRVIDAQGAPLDVLSTVGRETLAADKRAFAALMRHLGQLDGKEHTVILTQVENEPGCLGSVRDFSSASEISFSGPVPAGLAAALGKPSGSWRQVFGASADEVFQAYAVARYINEVAEAGKAEFALPMYVNVWLTYKQTDTPGVNYPSGGAVSSMLEIWKEAAPSIDLIGPDIYTEDSAAYRRTLTQYRSPNNALWIPETGPGDAAARYFFYALADGAIGFSPFGTDWTGRQIGPGNVPKGHAENFALLAPMAREIAALSFDGRLEAAVEEPGQPSTSIDLGKWRAKISFGLPEQGNAKAPGTPDHHGRALVGRLGANEFLVTGFDARVEFSVGPSGGTSRMQVLRAEEGRYQDGRWVLESLWNGDQTDYGLNFTGQTKVVRVRLGTY